MEKIKITKDNLKGKGKRLLGVGQTTDEEIGFYGWGDKNKYLKFAVVKGEIDDWCIYLESMNQNMTYDEVRDYGNKVSPEIASKLIDCSEVIKGYRL